MKFVATRGPAVLAAALVLGLVSAGTVQAQSSGVTVVAAFQPPTLPESVAVDGAGTIYTAGRPVDGATNVLKIARGSAPSTLATIQGPVAGVAIEPGGNVLVAVGSQNAPGTDANGVWRIRPDGSKQLAGAIAPPGAPNDILPTPGGGFYVTAPGQGVVYRITSAGVAEKWVEHDLTRGDPDACAPDQHPSARIGVSPGANGITYAPNGDLLLANTQRAMIVRVPVNPNGSAGTPVVWFGPDCRNLLGADGIAADGRGGVYVAANFRNQVVHLSSTGALRVLATSADGLDYPSSVKVGAGAYAGGLIVTNFANNSLSTVPPRPAIIAISPSRVLGSAVGLPRTGSHAEPRWFAVVLGAGLLMVIGFSALLGPPDRRLS